MSDLSPTAKKIHKMKYAKGDETWEQTCLRVAKYIAGLSQVVGCWLMLVQKLKI
jgi:hypothetical protein